MYPTLFELGPLAIPTHAFFVGVGVLIASLVVVAESRRRGLWGEEMLVAVAGGLVGGALGMRAAGWLRHLNPADNPPVLVAWQYGAKSVLGGLTGAYLGVLIGKRLIGWRARTGDVFAPAVALGMAVGRIGCLLTEPPGRPTSLPFGITLSTEQVVAIPGCADCPPGQLLHASFAYEITFQLAAFLALLWLRNRLSAPGELFTLYLAAYAVFRFIVEFTRANEVVALGLTRSQWFLLAVFPLLAWRLLCSARAGHYTGLRTHTRAVVVS